MLSTGDIAARFREAIRNFRDDRGAVTVEFVLWVPVFIVILALTVDVSLMFLTQSNLWQVARDTARQVSIRQLTTEAQAESYAVARANATFSGDAAEAAVNIDIASQQVTVALRTPIRGVGVFGVLGIGGDNDLTAAVTQKLEPF